MCLFCVLYQQSNEVGNSVRMEKEGFERSLSFLEGKGVVVKAIVTDRHTGVQKFLREQRPGISHYFDPWHMGKGKCLNWKKRNNKKIMQFYFLQNSLQDSRLLYLSKGKSVCLLLRDWEKNWCHGQDEKNTGGGPMEEECCQPPLLVSVHLCIRAGGCGQMGLNCQPSAKCAHTRESTLPQLSPPASCWGAGTALAQAK